MKKILIGISVFAFIVFGFSSASWAMGKRGGGHSSGNHNQNHGSSSVGGQSDDFGADDSSDQNDGPSTQNFNNNQNHGENSDNNSDDNNNGDTKENSFFEAPQSGNSGDERFPAATPVPEPATLSLMGMGLAAVLLKGRKR